MPAQPAIETENLSMRFGQLMALTDLSIALYPGDVFGFIGPNGAGKSTAMKIICGLLKPTSGVARVLGNDVSHSGQFVRKNVGYMPDSFGVYDDLTVTEYLEFFASAYGLKRSDRRSTVSKVLSMTELSYKEHAKVDSLSKGMQQRLGLARVLIHDPPVLLLDEPASGLDPRARIEIRELLKRLQEMGKTIMVSSHILTELGEFSTKLGIIERGRLLVFGTQKELADRARVRAVIVVQTHPEQAARAKELLAADPRVSSIEQNGGEMRVSLADAATHPQFILEILVANQVRIDSFATHELKLEEVFMRLTQGIVN